MSALVGIVLGVGALVSWIVAVASAIAMTRHRAPGVTLLYLAFNGIAFFDMKHFEEPARVHRKRLLSAFAAFFGCVLVGAVAGIALSAR